MEPISLMVAALVAGATTALKDTAAVAVKDAYQGLKTLIQRKWNNVDVALLESAPTSPARQAVMREELERTPVHADPEVQKHLQALLAALQTHAPQALTAAGVKLSDLEVTGSVHLADIASTGDGVDISKSKIGGDLRIVGVTAGETSPRP